MSAIHDPDVEMRSQRSSAHDRALLADTYGTVLKHSKMTMFKALLRKSMMLQWRRWRVVGAVFSVLLYGGLILGVYFGIKIPLQNNTDIDPDKLNFVLQISMSIIAPLLLCLAQISMMQNLVSEMVSDKESKMKIVQLVNGVPILVYWLTFLTQFMMYAASFGVVFTIILKFSCMPKSDPLLIWFVVELGYIQIAAFAAVISTIFEKARSASSVIGLLNLWAIIPCVVGQFLTTGPKSLYYVLGFLPCFELVALIQAIIGLEIGGPAGDAVGWEFGSTFFKTNKFTLNTGGSGDSGDLWKADNHMPSAGTLLLWFVVQSGAFVLFAYWFDQIWQGDFGAAKPKTFCLRPAYMCPRRRRGSTLAASEAMDPANVLEIRAMTKEFKRGGKQFKAVDQMSLSVRRGELFALLGHNGAGKSTAINCLTGMMPMTSGSAYVMGASVEKEIERVRWNLAICPQDNPMYPELTVQEHMQLFCAVRGSRSPDTEIPELLQSLGLTEKTHARCDQLSGGQKRRLWVATSLIGDAPLVFLDEPTSGMDPSSRRELWELLISMKERGRSIIFTTHYLEEADILADRKAVLAKGRVLACGTSRELKMQLGQGYHLRVFLPHGAGADKAHAVGDLVRRHVPTATDEEIPEEERVQSRDGPQLAAYTLPFAALEGFGPLLEELEQRTQELGVVNYELAMTSLEEVFMELGKREEEREVQESGQVAVEFQEVAVDAVGYQRQEVPWANHVRAIVQLQWRMTLNDKRTLWRTVIFPIAFIVYDMLAGNGWKTGGNFLDGSGALTPGLVMSIPAIVFTLRVVADEVTKAKHVMISQGVPPSAYWAGHALENYLVLMIVSVCIPLVGTLLDQEFMKKGQGPIVWVMAFFVPLPVLCFSYNCSRLFNNVEVAMKSVPLLNIVFGIVPGLAVNVVWLALIQTVPDSPVAPVLHVIFSLFFPFYSMAGVLLGLWILTYQGNASRIIGDQSVFEWLSHWQVLIPIIGTFWMTAVLGALLVLVDTRSTKTAEASAAVEEEVDEDVVKEAGRVQQADPTQVACMYRGLHHSYATKNGPVHAVRDISLAVQTGECFGLLGPNGAGKTTTLACLTGEIRPPTAGEVYVAGNAVHSQQVFEAYKHLGNCPQIDPLWPTLSGFDHVKFYAMAKGVPETHAAPEAYRLLSRLGLDRADADKPAGQYSGGMKRKLSVAVSLVGASDVLFLDEPSAAVDAAAKRHLWKVIKRRAPHQSVIVTTHSMEEAEALCDRLAIQTVGRLRCLGSPIHIKQKYGSGYQLELYTERSARESVGRASATAEQHRLLEFVQTHLDRDSTLLEAHSGRYLFQLPPISKGLTLGQVFTKVHAQRQELHIVDYSVAQPTLEQVFLRFAKEQEEANAAREAA
uniref:ABC transporter domain-containing protein n=1 Tax=Oxyrrhis marina TaxID=2969 RepID=A0A7S4GQD5_OXYMA|mmetsp:Transcript_11084/g.28031  ORF Transcript_11084/g.28031 Transcript_11084/m.28031 type:complete len:1378 (+) Transcript_11084:53-4186(+)